MRKYPKHTPDNIMLNNRLLKLKRNTFNTLKRFHHETVRSHYQLMIIRLFRLDNPKFSFFKASLKQSEFLRVAKPATKCTKFRISEGLLKHSTSYSSKFVENPSLEYLNIKQFVANLASEHM